MLGRIRFLLIITAVFLGGGLSACLDEVPEELVSPVQEIPVPSGLRAVVGEDSLTLYWDADANFNFSGFTVYRAESDPPSWSKLGEGVLSPFGDGSVRAGMLYFYRVSGLDSRGLEGDPSASLLVQVSVYSLKINGGDKYTNNPSVTLYFTAPVGTQFVMVSSESDFSGAEWTTYRASDSFTLPNGDGPKVVYAKFIDEFGNQTEVVSDSIILDMHASIGSLTYSPPSPISPGETMHFRVVVSDAETDGTVMIAVPGLGTDIIALDDGFNGDGLAGDGVYERDFTLPSTFRGTELILTAVFIDEGGNQSDEAEFPSRFDMTDPPDAVTLFPAVDSTTTSIELRWSKSEDEGFIEYSLYRDSNPGVTELTSDFVTSVMEPEGTWFTDSGVLEGETYHYAVFVKNDLNESTKSNEIIAHTQDVPPAYVVLDTVTSVGTDRLTLTWSRNEDTDFQEYRVYQATTPGVTDADVLVGGAPISDRYRTYLDATGLDLSSYTYYFRVYVFDKGGYTSRSNEVSTE